LFKDLSGFPTAEYQTGLNTRACALRAVLPPAVRDSFGVFSCGFYVLQDAFQGFGYPEAFERARTLAAAQKPYYLLFGRQSDPSGEIPITDYDKIYGSIMISSCCLSL
jgi:hypothetical protein